jgi:superfamily II DNA or RNA helicase
MRNALFHSKVWLFKDGHTMAALHGSANMTDAGLGRNREQLSLSRAWLGGDAARTCARLVEEFEVLWAGGDDDCIVVDLPRALQERLIAEYKTDRSPTGEDFRRLWRKAQGLPDAPDPLAPYVPPEFSLPDGLDYRTGDFAHQGQAVDAWRATGWRGILEMCTGSGKTLTAMVGAHGLHEAIGPLLIVVSAPYKVLLEQWCEEIALFGLNPINLSDAGGPEARERLISTARRRLRLGVSHVEALVVSNDTLVTPEFVSAIERFGGSKLLIADECHNLGAESFIGSPPTCFEYRLGLSATPVRQYDDDGTAALVDYFGPVCFSFTLEEAIGKCLTPYDYFAHFVPLDDAEMVEWRDLSEQIGRHAWKIDAGLSNDQLNFLLLKRRRVLETATSKLSTLAALLDAEDLHELRYTLIYATDKAPQQLLDINAILQARDVMFHQLTAEETGNPVLAKSILERFQTGRLQVLTAKRVLDEGVNVPQIERAYILASTTVRRQWIQRRGRLLRTCKAIGKTHAVIHDLVALPPEAYDGKQMDAEAKKIVNGELDRVWEFARLSRNGATTDGPFAKVQALQALLKDRD